MASASIMMRAREFDALLGDDQAAPVRDWREVLATARQHLTRQHLTRQDGAAFLRLHGTAQGH